MSSEEIIPPDAHLMESMRAVGYSLEAAVADLVDNAVTAEAQNIDLAFASEPSDFVALLDDGRGMTVDQAREAMRLAGRSSVEQRSSNDLGRFGLGLKTASISQARELVLASHQGDEIVAYRWDLDHIADSRTWSLQRLEGTEVDDLPMIQRLRAQPRGTLVLWRKLDQLRNQVGQGSAALDSAMAGVRDHLGLVFHRFLQGEHGGPLNLTINSRRVEPIDPFLTAHRMSRPGPAESFVVDGEKVTVHPYTIPRLAGLTRAERDQVHAAGQLRDSQGFYIYRAMRLVIWGTWFRIQPKQDLAKLARVRVDVPNTLDHLWALDIKKSAAQPPPAVRDRLRRIAEKIIVPSRKVHEFRGITEKQVGHEVLLWQVRVNGDEFAYEINRDHPSVVALGNALGPEGYAAAGDLLTLIEKTLPADDLFNRLTKDQVLNSTVADDALRKQAEVLWRQFRRASTDAESFVRGMRVTAPFNETDKAEQILREATQIND
ncbi:ATP-binding protein [Pedococcus ginsenosidimutans]|uniref:ATP-binding protein n=1 Tax=Pedococcus ginsenosidimutans TaxID=490570 RepID=A0ABP8Y065_9MICO